MSRRPMSGVGRWLSSLALSAALLAGPLAGSALAITLDNVIQMHKSGLPSPVIIQTIQSTGATFNLSVADVKKLKKAGVPQDVIDLMTEAGGGGAPAPEPEPEPEVDELERLRQSEEDARQRIEEDSRVRSAARRAAQAERQRMEAEERRRIAAALEKARDALEERNYGQAAREFDTFISNAEEGRASTLQAQLGLADSMYGLRYYGNAAERYHELLIAGPESDVFIPAFRGLRRCAKYIAYNAVTLEALTQYYVGNAPEEFQDSYNYFLGKFFFDYNRHDEGRQYLGEVSDKGDDFADAQYLIGLMGIADAGDDQEADDWARKIIGSARHFEAAVSAAEQRDEARVAHLAYLALARISYSVGLFDVAIYYYRKVPYDSTSYVNALHESGWSYFLKGDTRRGMGIFHTLDGPDWTNNFLPDTHLLEATVFMNTCHFDYAHDALKRIEDRYLQLKPALVKFLNEHASPEALYGAFVLKKVKMGAELPNSLRMSVISNTEFYDLYTTVKNYRREVARIKQRSGELGDDLAARLIETVETRKMEGSIALGLKINQLLQGLRDELDDLDVQVTEIKIEIDETAAEELEKSIEETYRGPSAAEAEAKAQATATILVGDKYVTWPFEGEYWADEINSYRSDLTEVCKR